MKTDIEDGALIVKPFICISETDARSTMMLTPPI